eukprot:gene57946-biopygen108926
MRGQSCRDCYPDILCPECALTRLAFVCDPVDKENATWSPRMVQPTAPPVPLPCIELIRNGSECQSNDIQKVVYERTLYDCALACLRRDGCIFFIYGVADKRETCYWEQTSSAECPEGFEVDEYAFHRLCPSARPVPLLAYERIPDKGCPGNNLDMTAHALQCYRQCGSSRSGMCSGNSDSYGQDSNALCAEQDVCEQLCAARTDCHGVEMHQTLPRCYLSTMACGRSPLSADQGWDYLRKVAITAAPASPSSTPTVAPASNSPSLSPTASPVQS